MKEQMQTENKIIEKLRVFKKFLDHCNIEIIYKDDGTVIFESKDRQTVVGQDGSISREPH